MTIRRMCRGLVVATTLALVITGSATADDEQRGIDPNQGRSLVEVNLPDKAAAIQLQLKADEYGVDFNEHYLRQNSNGSVTVTVFGTEEELAVLHGAGYALGRTIEGPDTWEARLEDRAADVKAEQQADAAALGAAAVTPADPGEIVVLRVDYFENYAGRFLSVEAKDRLGGSTPTGSTYTGPTLSLSWNTGAGTPIDATPRVMNVNIDPDTSPDTYIEHRELVRIGDPLTTSPAQPTLIRIGSSTGACDRGSGAGVAGRRSAADEGHVPERLHDPATWIRRRSMRASARSPPSSRTSPS